MEPMELENIEKVRHYALKKYCDILAGEFELPKFQSMDNIETEYLSKDVDTKEFVDQGLFGLSGIKEVDLVKLLEKIDLFYDKLQNAKTKFSDSSQIKELKIRHLICLCLIHMEHFLKRKG